MQIHFRCAHVPSGNGVIERCHRSVKIIAAKKGYSIREAVYRYNAISRDDKTEDSAPVCQLYRHRVRIEGLHDATREPDVNESVCQNDKVWVRQSDGRCNNQYDNGAVTHVVSNQRVEVNSVSRHARHLRPRAPSQDSCVSSAE